MICSACNGSGEGLWEGGICHVCRGDGEVSETNPITEDQEDEADYRFEQQREHRIFGED